jgi:hypothetical protein
MEEQRRKKLMEYFANLLKGKEVPSQVVETKSIGIVRIHLQ